MRAKMDYYKQFIDVNAGGGRRRNPKRKNAGGYSSASSMVMPTEEEIERVFEAHLLEMAKGGTYGDNMELSAFSSAFQMDVKIYRHDYAYVVSPAEPGPSNGTVYIAYHVSIRFRFVSAVPSAPSATTFSAGPSARATPS